MAIYKIYPKSVSQNPKPYENTFKLFTLDTCTSAVANQVYFRTSVSICIQQAQFQGVGPQIPIGPTDSGCQLRMCGLGTHTHIGARARHKPKLRVRI